MALTLTAEPGPDFVDLSWTFIEDALVVTATEVVAYASLDDYNAILETKLMAGSPKAARIEDLLVVAAEELIAECGRDFLRHPTSGSETFTIDGQGGNVLHFHEGLVGVDLLEYSDDRGASYIEFASGDWSLRGVDYSSSSAALPGEPYFHLVLNPLSTTRTSFPRGQNVIRITGARGWAFPPRRLVEANAQRARQIAYGDATHAGSLPGPEEMNPYDYAQRLVSFRWPDVAWNFIRSHNRRFIPCSM